VSHGEPAGKERIAYRRADAALTLAYDKIGKASSVGLADALRRWH
jgi:hypothetical protein